MKLWISVFACSLLVLVPETFAQSGSGLSIQLGSQTIMIPAGTKTTQFECVTTTVQNDGSVNTDQFQSTRYELFKEVTEGKIVRQIISVAQDLYSFKTATTETISPQVTKTTWVGTSWQKVVRGSWEKAQGDWAPRTFASTTLEYIDGDKTIETEKYIHDGQEIEARYEYTSVKVSDLVSVETGVRLNPENFFKSEKTVCIIKELR